MGRRFTGLLLCVMLLVTLLAVPAFAQQQIQVTVDGRTLQFDVPPAILDGRTLVPLKGIFEALGATVQWNAETRTVTGRKGSDLIVLPIDSRYPTVNGSVVELNVPATILNGRTLVPARFIAESLGAEVGWNPETRTVIITSAEVPAIPPVLPPVTGTEPLKVVLLINGSLSDQPFFDSAVDGMQLIKNQLGAEVNSIEMPDPGQWRSTLQRVSGEDWDIVITGSWQMIEHVEAVAPQFPDKRYILFDAGVDYSTGALENVYSIIYLQNEGAFLAGALAARVTASDLPLANEEKVIGFIGGMDLEVIRDFLVGYIQGARHVDPEVKVRIGYTNSFTDETAGRSLALSQYQAGADIIFSAAGSAGLGQIAAAKELNRYAIGVDNDQGKQFERSDPAKANHILTSVVKRIGNTLLQSVEKHLAGTLPYGSAEAWGLAQEAVGLADNAIYQRNVPAAFRSEINRLAGMIAAGSIRVDSVSTLSEAEYWQLVDSVTP
ncbi:MAG: BMP family ABC transporter substrate-binding protein [Bacillota bacterium]|nr:BMP family ABC transporter substrate-binding protein [Bacillota bacterium]MDW7678904.1 BMP family ABC transporter substrate-binding protein [Bacillota bacterium]